MARQRASILAAAVVGCSRMMPMDEEGMLGCQKAHREEFIDPKIAEQ